MRKHDITSLYPQLVFKFFPAKGHVPGRLSASTLDDKTTWRWSRTGLLPAHKVDLFNAGFYYPTLTDDDNSMWGISSRRNDTAVFQSLPWALEGLLGFGPATQVGPLAQLLLWTKRVLGASTVAWKWTFDYGQPSLTVYSDSSETATTSVFRWPTTSAAVNTLRRLPKMAHGDVTEVLTCLWAATSKTRG